MIRAPRFAAARMNATACVKFFSGSGPHCIWMRAIFVFTGWVAMQTSGSEAREPACPALDMLPACRAPGKRATSPPLERLVHGIGRNNLDALDHDTPGGLAHLALRVSFDGRVTDFFQHIVAFDHFAERCVLMVEPMHRSEADEELRAGRVRVSATRHGNY